MPEFKINYDSFKQDALYSTLTCGLMFLLSLPTAFCKKPFFSFLYITLGCFASLYVLIAAEKCFDFHRVAGEVQLSMCRNSTRPKEIQDQMMALIYPYMCTPECRCYSGSNNETRELWSAYDESLILPFKRNNIDKTTLDAGNNEIFPLAWTDE